MFSNFLITAQCKEPTTFVGFVVESVKTSWAIAHMYFSGQMYSVEVCADEFKVGVLILVAALVIPLMILLPSEDSLLRLFRYGRKQPEVSK